jgi:hypothetical protein
MVGNLGGITNIVHLPRRKRFRRVSFLNFAVTEFSLVISTPAVDDTISTQRADMLKPSAYRRRRTAPFRPKGTIPAQAWCFLLFVGFVFRLGLIMICRTGF